MLRELYTCKSLPTQHTHKCTQLYVITGWDHYLNPISIVVLTSRGHLLSAPATVPHAKDHDTSGQDCHWPPFEVHKRCCPGHCCPLLRPSAKMHYAYQATSLREQTQASGNSEWLELLRMPKKSSRTNVPNQQGLDSPGPSDWRPAEC